MAAIIQFSQNSAVTDGAFAPGAQVSFFLTGTTTPVTVYTDEARTIPHPTPVVANASGQFPLIWGEDDVNLKAVVTASDGSAIDTYDPVILGNISARTAAGTSFTPITGVSATDVQGAIASLQDNKADLASPALTGTPVAPTASVETNNTQIATTAFVANAIVAFPFATLVVPGSDGGSTTLDVTNQRGVNLDVQDGTRTITALTGGLDGQIVMFKVNSTLDLIIWEHSAASISLEGGTDISQNNNAEVLALICIDPAIQHWVLFNWSNNN